MMADPCLTGRRLAEIQRSPSSSRAGLRLPGKPVDDMPLTKLHPPREALMRLAAQGLMPTNLSSEELLGLSVDLRERAFFSARVMNRDFLDKVKETVTEFVRPQTVIRDGLPVTEGLDIATARLRLKDMLTSIGYQPDPKKRGTIEDLGSNQRLDLVLRTNAKQAQGFANWRQSQDNDILFAAPAQELFRAESREVPRNWQERWANAGGQSFGGRLIAVKNAPIWTAISRFGLPYPPFDFNSGMDVRDVERAEAISLGVISEGDRVAPEKRSFELTE